MTPEEFIKKFGVERAKQMVNADDSVHALVFATTGVSFLELKRLVESHELVKAWQLPEDDNDETGVDGARMYLECYAFYSTDEEKAKLDRLEQAIADVEACQ